MKKIFTLLLILSVLFVPFAADAKNKKADSNWKVKIAQQKLQILGFYDDGVNGKFTDTTKDGLKKFQKQHKLKVSGKLDDATYSKLIWTAFTKEGISKVQSKDILKTAAKFKGVPYKFGGTNTKGFDCSGYVQYVFEKNKAKLPRSADEQVLEGVFVLQKNLKPGDLVFFTTYAPGASHVGIYAGNDTFWNASTSKGVILSSMKEDYWKSRYYGARRVLVTNGEP